MELDVNQIFYFFKFFLVGRGGPEMYPSYPQLDTADFYGRVYHDARYYTGGAASRATHSREGGTFALMEQQHQLPLFLSPETGARTQYLYHGTGTGKSGTIALCALRFIGVNEKPVLFLVPNEHVKLEIEYEIMGREVTHVDGKSKSVFVRKFLGDAFITEQMRATLNSLETERAKDALCRKIWDEHVSRYFEITTHTKFENAVLGDPIPRQGLPPATVMTQTLMLERYGGRSFIVDEAHYMRKEKRLFQALMMVATWCRLSTMFLLTATPMIESAEEICPLVNLMLAVERVHPSYYLTPEVVRAYVTSGDHRAEQILRWCFRGRISYVRGLDPRTFPKRIDCGEKIFDDLPEHRVWPCYMVGRQLEAYIKAFMEEFIPNGEAGQRNDLWSITREVARCYTLKDMGRWTATTKGRRWLSSDKSENWKYRRMVDLSTKNVQMYEIIAQETQPTGPVLVYSSNIETGVRRLQAFFSGNGYRAWSIGQNIYPFKSYVDISGQVAFGRARDAIKILKSDKNYLGELLKAVIASPKIRTGVTMRHFSSVFLYEVDWTIGDREQIIGRTIRHGSHEHSSDPYCNKTVRVYVMCSRMRPSDLEAALSPVALKRLKAWIAQHEHALKSRGFLDEHSNLYTVDERTLRIALVRDREIAQVTRLMKEMMLPLNLAQNYFEDEGTQFSNTRLYEYMPGPARIPIPSDRFPSPCSKIPPTPTATDATFLNLDGWFRYVCSSNGDECQHLDFCGNIRRALMDALSEKRNWLISELLKHVSQQTHVTELEVALVVKNLSKTCDIHIELSTGWIYQSGRNEKTTPTTFDPIYEWQQQAKNDSPFLPPDPITNLHTILREANYVNVDDVFGTFQKRTPHIPIGKKIASYCVLLSPALDSTIYDITKTAPFCGVYDNTSDNPDEYQLKILTVKQDGKGTNKVSAHSKHDVDGLIGLVTEIDGDTGAVLESSHKKKAACDEISMRLEETGRLMPWDPEVDPTLLRALCIARAWDLRDVVTMIEMISVEVVESLEELCVTLLLGKHKIVLGGDSAVILPDKLKTIVHEQLLERVTTKADYVLRVLDRLENKRPRNLSVDQYATAIKWYEDKITNRFGEQLKNIRVAIRNAMESRCCRIVEERRVRGKGLKKKK